MTNELWANIMDVFLDILKARDPGLEQVIYLDRLGSHLQASVAAKCLKHQLWTIWFPPDTSEFLQPADAYQFGAFHHELNLVGERFQLSELAKDRSVHEVVLEFLQEALLRAISLDVVRAGFADTGIWPFNKTKILENANKFLSAVAAVEALPPVPPVIAEATAATLQVLERARPKRKNRHLHANIERSKVYLVDALIDADRRQREEAARQELAKEQRRRERDQERARKAREKEQAKEATAARRLAQRAEKERREAQKAADRETYSCRACGQRCYNRTSPTWLWCEYCDTFGVCPNRGLCPRGSRVLEEHERQERRAGKAALTHPSAPAAPGPVV